MTFENVKYRRLNRDESFSQSQFAVKKPRIPWKAITFAALLATIGCLLLIFSAVIGGGYADDKYSDRMWPILILGVLMFLPGAYHIRIAYFAFKGRHGYSFDEIPEFD